jgi:hypothetical protein
MQQDLSRNYVKHFAALFTKGCPVLLPLTVVDASGCSDIYIYIYIYIYTHTHTHTLTRGKKEISALTKRHETNLTVVRVQEMESPLHPQPQYPRRFSHYRRSVWLSVMLKKYSFCLQVTRTLTTLKCQGRQFSIGCCLVLR